MNVVVSSTGRWAVSARPTGEVLVARCDGGEISLMRFGLAVEPGLATEQQLNDLMDASRDAAAQAPSSGPIPALLHQVLARLLASHTVDNGGALIVLDDGDRATVATIGDVDAHLVLDGSTAHLPWVRVRDRAGHEARAYPLPTDRHSRFALKWPRDRQPGMPGVEIEASWPAGEAVIPQTKPAQELSADIPVSAPAEFTPRGRVPSYASEDRGTEEKEEKEGFLQWFDRMRGRRTQTPEATTGSLPERIPPTPEPEWLTAASVDAPIQTVAETITAAIDPPVATVSDPDPAQVPHQSPTAVNALIETIPVAALVENPPIDAVKAPTLLRPAWPEPELEAPVWKRTWAWGLLVVVLLGGGVLAANFAKIPAPPGRSLPTIFGPRFAVTVNSRPPGAWIAIDGKDTGRLTPTTLELSPGEHQVTLTLAGKGSITHAVRGERNERTSLDAALYGGVRVASADPKVPVSVTLDGLDRGYVPISIEDLLPGPHEIRFRAPGMDPWTETFEVRMGETYELVARPFTIPDQGVIEIRTTNTVDGRPEPLKGANIYIDGELIGTTPRTVELPHGPHSIRVVHRGEELPVQVIDLPGGNHRFADFAFGTGGETPRIVQLASPAVIGRDQPTVLSAALTGIAEDELREMWLHVRSPERTWKRYEMTLLRTTGGVVGVVVFPPTMLDANGAATYYMSAVMQVGDEYFTELRTPRRAGKPGSRPAQKAARRTANTPTSNAKPVIESPVPPTPLPTPSTGADTP